MTKFLLVAVVMVASVQASASPLDTALCAKIADAWKAAYNGRDAAKLAAMYHSAEGIYSNPYWTAVGRKDLETKFHAEFALGVKYASIVCDNAERHDNMLLAWGTYTANANSLDGKTMPVAGHWEAAAKKLGDGTYEMTAHNANIQLPPPH